MEGIHSDSDYRNQAWTVSQHVEDKPCEDQQVSSVTFSTECQVIAVILSCILFCCWFSLIEGWSGICMQVFVFWNTIHSCSLFYFSGSLNVHQVCISYSILSVLKIFQSFLPILKEHEGASERQWIEFTCLLVILPNSLPELSCVFIQRVYYLGPLSGPVAPQWLNYSCSYPSKTESNNVYSLLPLLCRETCSCLSRGEECWLKASLIMLSWS